MKKKRTEAERIEAAMALPGLDDIFHEELREPEFAAEYLAGCLQDGVTDVDYEAFFAALLHVVKANGVTAVAERSQTPRDTIYRALRDTKNPTFKTLRNLLHAVGLDISIVKLKTAKDSKSRSA